MDNKRHTSEQKKNTTKKTEKRVMSAHGSHEGLLSTRNLQRMFPRDYWISSTTFAGIWWNEELNFIPNIRQQKTFQLDSSRDAKK